MAYLGRVFKTFRESGGMKLTKAVKIGLSKSQLSRFEYGEIGLTIMRLMITLNEINIPIEEFMYAAHGFQQNELNILLEKTSKYQKSRDSHQWYDS